MGFVGAICLLCIRSWQACKGWGLISCDSCRGALILIFVLVVALEGLCGLNLSSKEVLCVDGGVVVRVFLSGGVGELLMGCG